MSRRRTWFSPDFADAQLERRELMSRPATIAMPAAVGEPQASSGNLFHKNGIDGLVLHRTFVNQLNDRLNTSKDQTARVTQAFQVFATSFRQLPVNPPPDTTGPTLDSLVATLKQQVAIAETRREALSSQATPSQKTSIRSSPLAPLALVPFASAQIDKMAATLAQLPPVAGPDGSLTTGDPTTAVNTAVNAILNSIAETSIHPLLFNEPSDFYLNPYITFTVTFSGAPASSAPGYFIRGPHGTILPGATLHPIAPN